MIETNLGLTSGVIRGEAAVQLVKLHQPGRIGAAAVRQEVQDATAIPESFTYDAAALQPQPTKRERFNRATGWLVERFVDSMTGPVNHAR